VWKLSYAIEDGHLPIQPEKCGLEISVERRADQTRPTLRSMVPITDSIFPLNTSLARLRGEAFGHMDGNMRIHSDSHYLKTLAEFVRFRPAAEERRAPHFQEVDHILASFAFIDQLPGVGDLLRREARFPAKPYAPALRWLKQRFRTALRRLQ
jgi:hypothetical protein